MCFYSYLDTLKEVCNDTDPGYLCILHFFITYWDWGRKVIKKNTAKVMKNI